MVDAQPSTVDAHGDCSAGFIDLQVNGALGIDFSSRDLTGEGARSAIEFVLAGGTAAFLPTLVSCTDEVYRANLPLLASFAADPALQGRVAGLHLEGPFLADDERVLGVHRAANLRAPDPAYLESLQRLANGTIRLLTVSAELPGIVGLVRAARGLGIEVGIGHSWASARQLAAVRDAGARSLTHFGNAVPRATPRHDNPLWAAIATPGLRAMLVVDGHHLPIDFARAVWRVFGTGSVALVSDQSPLAGLPPGCYRSFDQEVFLRGDGAVWNQVEQHLCGSSMSLLQVVNQALAWGLVDAPAALQAAYVLPMQIAGLSPGRWARTNRVGFDRGTGRFELLQLGR